MVPRSSDRISRVPPYLIRPLELRIRGCHPCRWPFQTILLTLQGSAGPRSLATTNGVSIDFLSSGYLDVSVQHVRSLFLDKVPCLQHGGFPHSDTHGSTLACSSPWLFAAYHVLLRLQEPRHPPYALSHFLFFFTFCFLIPPACQ